MHFYKMSACGQDYIFIDNEKDFKGLTKETVKLLCDRVCGIGATGIFTICENGAKNTQISAFDENGEIIRDFSTASICAALGIKITKGAAAAEISCRNERYFTYISRVDREKYLVSCDIGNCRLLLNDGKIQRKTELGNRILTLTPISTTADYAVHFSGCVNSLNRKYLSEKTSALSLFGGKTSLLLCEEQEKNSIEMLPMYEYGKDVSPYAGAYAAAGVAACVNGKCDFKEEIYVSCKDYGGFVIVEDDLCVTLHFNASIAYEGNI